MEKSIFTKEYVDNILQPFIGQELRMRSESIPFTLETSIESSFQILFTAIGVKIVLKDNYYIKRDLKDCLNNAIRSVGVYALNMNRVLKEEPKDELEVFNKLNNYFAENFSPQIAFIYYNSIKSLSIDDRGFVVNEVKFFKSR